MWFAVTNNNNLIKDDFFDTCYNNNIYTKGGNWKKIDNKLVWYSGIFFNADSIEEAVKNIDNLEGCYSLIIIDNNLNVKIYTDLGNDNNIYYYSKDNYCITNTLYVFNNMVVKIPEILDKFKNTPYKDVEVLTDNLEYVEIEDKPAIKKRQVIYEDINLVEVTHKNIGKIVRAYDNPLLCVSNGVDSLFIASYLDNNYKYSAYLDIFNNPEIKTNYEGIIKNLKADKIYRNNINIQDIPKILHNNKNNIKTLVSYLDWQLNYIFTNIDTPNNAIITGRTGGLVFSHEPLNILIHLADTLKLTKGQKLAIANKNTDTSIKIIKELVYKYKNYYSFDKKILLDRIDILLEDIKYSNLMDKYLSLGEDSHEIMRLTTNKMVVSPYMDSRLYNKAKTLSVVERTKLIEKPYLQINNIRKEYLEYIDYPKNNKFRKVEHNLFTLTSELRNDLKECMQLIGYNKEIAMLLFSNYLDLEGIKYLTLYHWLSKKDRV